MHHRPHALPALPALCVLSALLLASGLAAAEASAAPAAPATTPSAEPARRGQVELTRRQSRLSAGLPDGHATGLRGHWAPDPDTVLHAELLSEQKFGARGGVAAVGATRSVDADWLASASLTRGWGGPNWARTRVDGSVGRKWGASRQVVTTLGAYHGQFDAGRSDRGLRVSAHYYLNHFVVLEGGVAFNSSQPGRVRSQMPYLAATLGREGLQFLALRASRGSEAYQSVGTAAQLVDFDSQTYSLDWRYWLAPDWGLTLHAERYLNPSYRRTTVGGGLFLQL